MTSNYLTEKYPEEGYEKPFYPKLSLPWEKASKNQKAEEKRHSEIKYSPCIHVCKCGEEWKSNLGSYQEGCYPYIEGVCNPCKIKNDVKQETLKQKKIMQELLNGFDLKIPPRYRGKLKTPVNKILLTSICSIIWGGFGTGKTWEGYTVAKELIKNGEIKSFELISEIDLLNDLKANFDDMAYKIKKYKNLDLLIVDETGKVNDSDFNKAQLFSILNHRYDWEKKTILICNAKDKNEIRNLIPTAIIDRFRECVIEMKGKSLRYE